MGDKQQCTVKGLHGLLDPLPCGNVQMVGRLVQNEEIDLLVHQHTQSQAAQLAAGQHRHRLKHILPLKLVGGQPVPGALGRHTLFLVQHSIQNAALRVVKVNDLWQVCCLYRRPQLKDAAVRRFQTQQHIQQRRLSGAVFADQGDALTVLHPQIDVGEQCPSVEGLGNPLHLQHLVALELAAGKAGIHFFGLGGLLRSTHPLDALFHGEGPLMKGVIAHEGPQVHLLGSLFQLLDLGLLLEILLQALLVAALLLHGVEAVIPAVKLRLSVQHLDDAGNGAVQKIPVVGDGHHRATEGADVFLQPLRGLKVQMVGGLVQQQDIRVL